MKRIGFEIESFGEGTICVRSIPAILTNDNLAELMRDVVQELIDHGTTEKLDSVMTLISKVSCYGSIRSGRRLNSQEMNRLLRDMEANLFRLNVTGNRPSLSQLDEIESYLDVVETMMEARYLIIFAIIPLAIPLFVLISNKEAKVGHD